MEFLSADLSESPTRLLDRALQIPGLKSTHTTRITTEMQQLAEESDEESVEESVEEGEISRMMELAVATVLGLYLAQVLGPCKQCPTLNANLCCMELTSYITSEDNMDHNCVGVLEFLGFDYNWLETVELHLEDVELRSTFINLHPKFLEDMEPPNAIWRSAALSEVKNAFQLIIDGNIT